MLHLITVVLVILKALGYISFSWLICFAPSIFAITLPILFLIIAYIAIKKEID